MQQYSRILHQTQGVLVRGAVRGLRICHFCQVRLGA